jgi:UDP-glucose 4-epimerase
MASCILVTGGGGFIGSHTIVQLLELNHKVVSLDNFTNSSEESLERVRRIAGSKGSLLTSVKADLRDESAVNAVFEENSFTQVIHFAGLKAVGESVAFPLMYYENNISGTIVLLKMMQKHQVKHLVFSSSATVYGTENQSPFSESMPITVATNPYGKTKLYLENLIQDVCAASHQEKKIQAILLRYFNPIGAHPSGLIGESPTGVPNNLMPFVLRVALGSSSHVNVFGGDYSTSDGTAERDYVHVMDIADGHIKALDFLSNHQTSPCEVFNLGTGESVSVLRLIRSLAEQSKISIPFQIVGRREGDIPIAFSNSRKANEILGWKATRSLEDMCRDGWNWAQNNPNGYSPATLEADPLRL